MEIISEQSGFSREAREEKGESGGALFLWTLVIIVLIGLNAFSWIFCMYVFGNPEQPFCYDLLNKVEKIDPIQEYTGVTAPRGRFLSARDLYTDQYGYEDDALPGYNRLLMRDYLMNFTGKRDILFINGQFRVQSVRTLGEDDVFPTGLAIRAQAEDFPAAFVDYIIPTELTPEIPWKQGDILKIERGESCAFVLHIKRAEEEEVIFTAVPLVSGERKIGEEQSIVVKPPERLNLAGSFPLSSDPAPMPQATPVETTEVATTEETQ